MSGRRVLSSFQTSRHFRTPGEYHYASPMGGTGSRQSALQSPEHEPRTRQSIIMRMVVCPGYDCFGGYSEKVEEVKKPESVGLPKEIWDSRGDKQIWYCNYCRFIWSTHLVLDAPQPYTIRLPIGYFNGEGAGPGFQAVPNARMKPEPKQKSRRR